MRSGNPLRKAIFVFIVAMAAITGFDQLKAEAKVVRTLEGWTRVIPSPDSRIIYVSSSQGNDANPGFSPEQPKKTILAGKALMRNGFPDHLLLKRGDVWSNESIGNIMYPGRSPDEPALIGTYGVGPRPLLKTGDQTGIRIQGGGASNPINRSNIIIMGLHLKSQTKDYTSREYTNSSAQNTGILFLAPSALDSVKISDIIVEDVKVEFYSVCITIQGAKNTPFKNVTVRRSIFNNCYSRTSHSQGLYANFMRKLLIEENVFYHNGWGRSRDGGREKGGATIFNHNMYINGHTANVVVSRNFIADASSHGIQMRAGGKIQDNLFVRNPINILIAGQNNKDKRSKIENNIILEPTDISTDLPRGMGLDVVDTQGAQIVGNVVAHDHLSSPINTYAIKLIGRSPSASRRNLVVNNIFFDIRRGFVQEVGDTDKNNISGNLYWCDENIEGCDKELNIIINEKSFYDPIRDLGSYDKYLGGIGTYESFVRRLISRPIGTWPEVLSTLAINSYIREGFSFADSVLVKGPH